MKNNELQLVVEQAGLEQSKVETVLKSFSENFNAAKETAGKANAIVVTSEDQKNEMLEARKLRLQLKEIRVNVENTRKELKEQSLREGKAIDGAANIIKALIVPVEEYLEKQEKFAEVMAAKRKAELLAKRTEELGKYVEDLSIYSLGEISEERYATLLTDSKAAYEARIAAAKKAEEERVEKEKKVKLYYERKELLIPYWGFLKGDQPSTDFGELPEESFQIILKEAKQAKIVDDKKQEEIKKENEKLRKEAEAKAKKEAEAKKIADAKLLTERLAREKAEKELADKKASEEKAKKEAEEKAREEELARLKAEKEALLAPDKEKMRIVYKDIKELAEKINATTFTTEAARKVGITAVAELQTVLNNMAARMKNL